MEIWPAVASLPPNIVHMVNWYLLMISWLCCLLLFEPLSSVFVIPKLNFFIFTPTLTCVSSSLITAGYFATFEIILRVVETHLRVHTRFNMAIFEQVCNIFCPIFKYLQKLVSFFLILHTGKSASRSLINPYYFGTQAYHLQVSIIWLLYIILLVCTQARTISEFNKFFNSGTQAYYFEVSIRLCLYWIHLFINFGWKPSFPHDICDLCVCI